jgi:hypothetical protein
VSFCERFVILSDNCKDVAVVVIEDDEVSDLSCVLIKTCSTMSSSVLALLDQHSSAAAMGSCWSVLRQDQGD